MFLVNQLREGIIDIYREVLFDLPNFPLYILKGVHLYAIGINLTLNPLLPCQN